MEIYKIRFFLLSDCVPAAAVLAGALLWDEQRLHGNTHPPAVGRLRRVRHLPGPVVMDWSVSHLNTRNRLYL